MGPVILRWDWAAIPGTRRQVFVHAFGFPARETGLHVRSAPRRTLSKGALAMIYGEPETLRFLAAVQRMKRDQRRKERQTRLAKQRVRAVLRKMREC